MHLRHLLAAISLLMVALLAFVIFGFPSFQSRFIQSETVFALVALIIVLSAISYFALFADQHISGAIVAVSVAVVLTIVTLAVRSLEEKRIAATLGYVASASVTRQTPQQANSRELLLASSLREECEIITPDIRPVTDSLSEVAQLCERGNESIYAYQFADAVRYYEAALQIAPINADLWHNLGIACLNTDIAKALRAFQSAVAIRPDVALFSRCEAFAHSAMGEYEAAISALRRALEIDPQDGVLWLQFGVAAMKMGIDNTATEALMKSHGLLGDDPDVLLCLGKQLEKEGLFSESEVYLKRALEINPVNCNVITVLGNLLNKLGRADEALAIFQRAREIEPSAPGTWQCLGWSQVQLGFWPSAEESFREALKLDGAMVSAYEGLAHVLCKQERWDESEVVCLAGLSLDPANTGFLNELTDIALHRNNLDVARQFLDNVLEGDGLNHRAHEQSARLYRSLGDICKAIDHALSAVESDSKCEDVRILLSEMLLDTEGPGFEPRRAESLLREWVIQFSQSHNIYERWGRALRYLGELDEAVSVTAKAVELDSDCGPARFEYASALAAIGRCDDSEIQINAAAELGAPSTSMRRLREKLAHCIESQEFDRMLGMLGPALAGTLILLTVAISFLRRWKRRTQVECVLFTRETADSVY